ncbi:hypothetical protein GCM10023169_06250 [Georgenia halophila]|uniref:Uncharacterized protein n=1 Tax=Georgenia halophila TaxID=620889 RepID=A0ABP8KWH4_9MICO
MSRHEHEDERQVRRQIFLLSWQVRRRARDRQARLVARRLDQMAVRAQMAAAGGLRTEGGR